MMIDGKSIARDREISIGNAIKKSGYTPRLAIIVVGEDPVIANFVRIKKRVGERLGITIVEENFSERISGEELIRTVVRLAHDTTIDGIIVQLPLPSHIDTEKVLSTIPVIKDVDVLSREAIALYAKGESMILPPVAGAIQEIFERAQVQLAGKEALVLGHGRLVGIPAALLLRHNEAHVTVIDRPVPDLGIHLREAEIIISGVGKPGLILPEMLSKGVVLIDAGTSESGSKIMGDADPGCADVAGVFTPVPGGVGPISVVMIFKNLCMLSRR